MPDLPQDLQFSAIAITWHLLLSSVIVSNFSNMFSSETTEWIWMKLSMIILWGILHKVDAWIFDQLKSMTTSTEKKSISVKQQIFLQISKKTLGISKFWHG